MMIDCAALVTRLPIHHAQRQQEIERELDHYRRRASGDRAETGRPGKIGNAPTGMSTATAKATIARPAPRERLRIVIKVKSLVSMCCKAARSSGMVRADRN
ncbi:MULTISPECIES: hypothetical protein [unclassified Bradyrhizobium]